MNNLHLEIEGINIELLDSDNLANVLTLDFKTGLNDSAFSGGSTRTPISIPATARNRTAFESLGFLNASRTQSKVQKNFNIYINNTLYRSGKCRLIRVDNDNNLYSLVSSVYKLGLYFDNLSFFSKLAALNLKDVTKLGTSGGAEYVTWASDIEAVSENGIALNTISDITYIPVKYSVFLGVDADGRYVRNDEFTPAIQLHTLLSRALESIEGSSYTLDSTFFGTTYFRSLIMPLTAMEYPTANHKYLSEVEINVQSHTVNLGTVNILTPFTTPGYPLTAPYSAANGDKDVIRTIDASLENWQSGSTVIPGDLSSPYADNIFVAEIEGSYEIEVTLQLGTINITGGSFTHVDLVIHRPNNINSPLSYTSERKGINSTLSTQEVRHTVTFYALAGQEVRVGLAARNETIVSKSYVSGTIVVNSGQIKVKPLQIYANRKDSLIVPRYMLGEDWTALSIIKGITHLFNLEWHVDEFSKTVKVEPKHPYTIDNTRYEGFYSGTTDMNSKLDISKKSEILEIKNKEKYTLYTYKEGSDPTIEGLEDGAVVGVNTARYERVNYIDDSTKKNENPFFTNLLMFKDKFLEDKDNSAELAAMPLLYPTDIVQDGDNNETTQESNGINTPYPILLFFEPANGTTSAARIRAEYIRTGGAPYVETSKGFITDYNASGSTRSLSFADVDRGGTIIRGLFNTFHAYDAISKDIGNLVRCEFTLNALDLAGWSFEYANWIVNNLKFTVQSIEKFSILNNKNSRVDILEYVVPTSTDYNRVQHTELLAITTTNVDVP